MAEQSERLRAIDPWRSTGRQPVTQPAPGEAVNARRLTKIYEQQNLTPETFIIGRQMSNNIITMIDAASEDLRGQEEQDV